MRLGSKAESLQASNSALPTASSATTSPRARLSSPIYKAPTWTRRSGSGHTSFGQVRGRIGCLRAGAVQAGSPQPLTPGLSSLRRPLPGPQRKPQRAGLRLRGARVPGRAAGSPGAVRGAGAPAAGLHAAAARGRSAFPAAPALLRRQPHCAAVPGAAAAPGIPGPALRQVPVTGRAPAALVPQFLLLLLRHKPLPSPL